MNRQSFLKLVENPSLLSEDTIVGLATIVADYPFFKREGCFMLRIYRF